MWGKWSASRLGRFGPLKEPPSIRWPLCRKLGGPQNRPRDCEVKNICICYPSRKSISGNSIHSPSLCRLTCTGFVSSSLMQWNLRFSKAVGIIFYKARFISLDSPRTLQQLNVCPLVRTERWAEQDFPKGKYMYSACILSDTETYNLYLAFHKQQFLIEFCDHRRVCYPTMILKKPLFLTKFYTELLSSKSLYLIA
jgi:hypothetical protein